MKRFLIGLALCFMPVFSLALPVCSDDKISFTCSEDGGNKQCQFYEYFAGNVRDCELPDKYKDEQGRACFKNGDVSPCEKQNDDGKQPKTDKPPEEGKTPKQPPTAGKCYRSGTVNARPGSECSKAGWAFEGYRSGKVAYCTNSYEAPVMGPCQEEEQDKPKQPKQPEQKEPKKPNPNDGKQPKHEDGKQPKGEGQGDDKGEKQPKGEGSGDSSVDNGGKGSKGEGNGKGEGSGDAEGKGMFKGGAGSGHISEVRVPKSRDGLGWRGDFFLRNANQCPQDKVLTLMGKQVVFSYTNICKYLDMISPIVKAICMFVAGMMVVRSIRAK